MSNGPSARFVPDTSAWIEFLRGTGSPLHRRVRELLLEPGAIVVTEPVMTELLTGARDAREWRDLQRLLAGVEWARVQAPTDWLHAAALHRRIRLGGRTVASMLDCLIAAVAIRIGAAVLHADADFDLIAEHSALEVAAT